MTVTDFGTDIGRFVPSAESQQDEYHCQSEIRGKKRESAGWFGRWYRGGRYGRAGCKQVKRRRHDQHEAQYLKAGETPAVSLFDAFVGRQPEIPAGVCIPVVAVAFLYLVYRKIASPNITLSMLLTVAAIAFFAPRAGASAVSAGYELLADCGFKYTAIYRRHKPEFKRIEL